jgi:hypothetical protein
MSIFSKLFGKKTERFDLEPTAEMMDEDTYWKLIADSLAATGGDQDDQAEYLTAALGELEPADIVGFRLRTDKLLHDSYNSEMWCAGYIMNGGCSDDMFEYFRLWVISRRREVYENARADPDSLISVADVEGPEGVFDFEALWYVALTAFEKKTGKALYDYIDYDNFKTCEGHYPQFDFTWTEEDPESRKKICPKLFKRFENS